jgi:hypothetical protein
MSTGMWLRPKGMQHGFAARFTPEERFWQKVDRSAGPDGCWLWTGGLTHNGYGRFALGLTTVRAHRYSYQLAHGPIPDGYEVDHVRARGCRHYHCVNPSHLEAVPPVVNVLRSDSLGAVNARKTHCKRGHELAGDNLIVERTGKRQCRICRHASERAYRERRRAA